MIADLRRSLTRLTLVLSALAAPVLAQNPTVPTPISLTGTGVAYTQDFNSLSNAAGESTALPQGWAIWETGSSTTTVDGAYVAGTGSGNTGDTYSFGAAGATDRAFGFLDSGSNTPRIGAVFTNNTGVTVTSLAISFMGEHWRRGNNTAGLADRLNFQISFNATSISDGAATWTDVDALDFASVNTGTTIGALDGNAVKQSISHTISSLSVPAGATFWIRWIPLDISGSDDGLSMDDFSLTPNGGGVTVPTLTISNVSQSEGNVGTTNFVFQVNLNAPAGAGGVSFTVNTADGSATTANNDYQAIVGQPGSIGAGLTSTTVTVLVNGDVTDEPNEMFSVNLTGITGTTNATASATGTIQNDDAVAGCTVTQTISQIQGPGEKSPLAGQTVTTSGIVTGLRSNSFFIQDPVGDGNPATSEGIFVFTSSAPPSAVAVGNSVCVTGPVVEFKRSADDDPTPFSLTEIDRPTSVTLLSTGNPLPAPATLTSTDLSNTGTLDQLERFENMRVVLPSAVTVAPTEGFGETFLTLTGAALPFRESGVISYQVPALPIGFTACPQTSQANPGQTGCVPVWDGNPELIVVDSDFLSGTSTRNFGVGAALSNVTGPLHYDFGTYRITTETTLPTIAPPATTPVPAPSASQLTVASFNVERFYDTIDDPGTSDSVVSQATYETKRTKIANTIKDVMRNPDVIGFQEVEKLTILQDLANVTNTANGGATNYQAYLVEGNDVGGIDVGFLVNANRVTVYSVQQFGKTDTYVCGTGDANGVMPLIHDRPPLVLKGLAKSGANTVGLPVTVIVNHFRSLLGLNDTDPSSSCGGQTDGFRVRTKRARQAEAVAQLAQSFQTSGENVVVLGDLNAFQFNDGFVDVTGGVKGAPAAVTEAVTPVADLLNPNLVNLVESVPAPQRYSFVFDGSHQVLDHVLVNTTLNARNASLVYGRSNADFPEFLRSDVTTVARVSDHDPAVAYFSLPTAVEQAVTIERLSLSWNIFLKRWVGSVRVTNTSGGTIASPISLCLTGLNTAQFTLLSGTNTLVGPCRSIAGTLAPGAQTSVTIQIEGPQTPNGLPTARPVFTEKLYSGTF